MATLEQVQGPHFPRLNHVAELIGHSVGKIYNWATDYPFKNSELVLHETPRINRRIGAAVICLGVTVGATTLVAQADTIADAATTTGRSIVDLF